MTGEETPRARLSSAIVPRERHLAHYGIKRKSGRYPWGSGGNETKRAETFFEMVKGLRAEGLTDTAIAKGFKMTTPEFRATTSIANATRKAADVATAQRYKDKQYSNVAIGKKMGKNESYVRSLLAEGARDKADQLHAIAQQLRDAIENSSTGFGFIDVGRGTEHFLGITKDRLATAVSILRSEGYAYHKVQAPQFGTSGQKTTIPVLAPKGTEYKTIAKNIGEIRNVHAYSNDHGRTFNSILPPIQVNPKRVKVNYAEDGGSEADGAIYIRPGVPDLSLGGGTYAQVRIRVGEGHFLKGMAIYKDDLPAGTDIVFNTNKKKSDIGDDKLSAMKPMRIDKETGTYDLANPFGSIVRQIGSVDERGKVNKLTSAINLVNEEGDWDKWSRNLSAQMLSKQKPALIKERLDTTFEKRKSSLDEIRALNNPVIKKKLLESESDSLDSAAVHLKAASMKDQKTQVILPINSLKDGEIYAPNFNHGDRVVLIRYPHGGTFEIPELVVNNNHPESKKIIGNKAADAVGINSKTAGRLSGADFDGDTVLVIPNNHNKIDHKPPLKDLEGFDPQSAYPKYEGMKVISPEHKQKLMGDVSNLVTDMTIRGAPDHEIAMAVRHSMVVIDAEKHKLNYKQSHIDNNIASLKAKYQGGARSGASTLISLAKSPERVDQRMLRRPGDGGPIDPKTGARVFVPTGKGYEDKDGNWVPKISKVKKLDFVDDAHTLSSGTRVEKLYADHSNRLKAMANAARKESLSVKVEKKSPSAAKAYSSEVASLNAKLALARRNQPLERQALAIANATMAAKKAANPDMDKAEIKKLEHMALEAARERTGAGKKKIIITEAEWEAIQSNAISPSKLRAILDDADLDVVKKLATPKVELKLTSAKQARAMRLLATGATQAQVAESLGVSLSTLKRFLSGG